MLEGKAKCRLCGEIFNCDGQVDGETAIERIALLRDNSEYIHFCEDGSVGLADFMGFKKCTMTYTNTIR